VVIGQAPRHLDRNVTLVGRVVSGMERLSVMPRGSGTLGFYEHAEQRTPLKSLRWAADVPAAQRTELEVLRTVLVPFFIRTMAVIMVHPPVLTKILSRNLKPSSSSWAITRCCRRRLGERLVRHRTSGDRILVRTGG